MAELEHDNPDWIRYEKVSRLGATVVLVDDELDQAQYDPITDVMSVAVEGAL